MAKRSLFIKSKDGSVKIKPNLISTGLFKGISSLARKTPGKAKILVEATKKFNNIEKAALFQATWEGRTKRIAIKQAKDFSPESVACLWDETVINLENLCSSKISQLQTLNMSGGGYKQETRICPGRRQPTTISPAQGSPAQCCVTPLPTVGASACAEPTVPTQPNPTQ